MLILLLLFVTTAAGQVRDSLPVPNVPGYRTLKGDFHMHTVFSDGDVWPNIRVTEAYRDGFDVIALTDHSVSKKHEKDVRIDLMRPYDEARDQAERMGIILIRGIELAVGSTHANALFVSDPNALRTLEFKEAVRQAVAQGAFVFWNHPSWKGPVDWGDPMALLHTQKLLHGVELVNGTTLHSIAYPWVEEKSLTIMANSDQHQLNVRRERPVTLVFARTADEAGVKEALFARRTAAWMGGEVWGQDKFLEGLWQGAVKLENPRLKARPGVSGFLLRLRNDSAIPFKFRVVKTPSWVQMWGGPLEARAEATTGVALNIKGGPADPADFEIEIELTNLHTGPGKNLTTRVPVRLEAVQ